MGKTTVTIKVGDRKVTHMDLTVRETGAEPGDMILAKMSSLSPVFKIIKCAKHDPKSRHVYGYVGPTYDRLAPVINDNECYKITSIQQP